MNKKRFLIILVFLFGVFCLGLNHVISAEPSASLRPDDDDDDDDDYIAPSPTAPMNSPIRKDTQKPVIKDFSLTAPKLFTEVSNK